MIPIGSFVLVSPLEQVEIGAEILRAKWPLHVTLVPWFSSISLTAVEALLSELASEQSSIVATVAERELFGPERTIPVNVFSEQTEIKLLHEKLSDLLKENGAEFYESEWMYGNFRAHVTRFESEARGKQVGDQVTLSRLCLVQLITPDSCRIRNVYEFNGQTAA